MLLISLNLAGARGRNRWGGPNLALRRLSHAPAEERHMQRSSGPVYPHIM